MPKKEKGAATAAPITLQYVGPDYQKSIGITTGDSHHLEVKPRDFDEATRLAFIEKHPELAHWWIEPTPSQEPEPEPEA